MRPQGGSLPQSTSKLVVSLLKLKNEQKYVKKITLRPILQIYQDRLIAKKIGIMARAANSRVQTRKALVSVVLFYMYVCGFI